ncbi:hypothetical protein [Saccharothrix coeruleofusca]|uniref:Uncharacterized protein n=1 Tax=Saccharothrix coeruleofusca TaxID=33919 RepID=A0A918EH29_9PSEU|nr:hypothetical protein [Saccharothrix coeruleofusca]GGP86967.1 hypothetical protein GCM10010185_70980 [Saccharothrix coeruleofusca]
MSRAASTTADRDELEPSRDHSRPEPKRINVAVSPETVKALQTVMDREGVSLTEAVRRLVGFGDFLYQAAKVEGAQVLVKQGDTTREIVLI